MTRLCRLVAVVGLAVPACTRINPSFGDEVRGSGSEATDTDGASGIETSVQTSGPPQETRTDDETGRDPTGESRSTGSEVTAHGPGSSEGGTRGSDETEGSNVDAVWVYASASVPGSFAASGQGNTREQANALCDDGARSPLDCEQWVAFLSTDENDRFADIAHHGVPSDLAVWCYDAVDENGVIGISALVASDLATLIAVGPDSAEAPKCPFFADAFWTGEVTPPGMFGLDEPELMNCEDWSQADQDTAGGIGRHPAMGEARWYAAPVRSPCSAGRPILCLCW